MGEYLVEATNKSLVRKPIWLRKGNVQKRTKRIHPQRGIHGKTTSSPKPLRLKGAMPRDPTSPRTSAFRQRRRKLKMNTSLCASLTGDTVLWAEGRQNLK